MASEEFRFRDGTSYETMMGVWSRLVAERFLDWLDPPGGLTWLDVGCGTGAFSQAIAERCAPAAVTGIDPSEAQLAFAHRRGLAPLARFEQGDAMALPYPDGAFDAASSGLVIFFMPDPARGVAEMARVVRPGGSISTYAWDLLGGGFPYEVVEAEMRAVGTPSSLPPHPEAAELDALRRLWREAGLLEVETTTIEVERTFDDFEQFWGIAMTVNGIRMGVEKMAPETIARLKQRVAGRLSTGPDGRLRQGARAHAVRASKPA
jgi:ubiquinone/menaquinone biosynthesis C-methylase UbiE